MKFGVLFLWPFSTALLLRSRQTRIHQSGLTLTPREDSHAHREREAPHPPARNPLQLRARGRPRRAEREQGLDQGGAALEHGGVWERARGGEGEAPGAPPAPRDGGGPRRHREQPLPRSGAKRRRLPRETPRRPGRSRRPAQAAPPHAPHPRLAGETPQGQARTRREEEDEGEGGVGGFSKEGFGNLSVTLFGLIPPQRDEL